MSIVAAVITGAQERHTGLIQSFARDLLRPAVDFAYIRQAGAEAALAKADKKVMLPEKQFMIRDVLESKAGRARREGANTCIVVSSLGLEEDSPEFGLCKSFMRRQRDVVHEWKLFREIVLACLTPSSRIITLH